MTYIYKMCLKVVQKKDLQEHLLGVC